MLVTLSIPKLEGEWAEQTLIIDLSANIILLLLLLLCLFMQNDHQNTSRCNAYTSPGHHNASERKFNSSSL